MQGQVKLLSGIIKTALFLQKFQLLIIGPVQKFKRHHENCVFEQKFPLVIVGAVLQFSSAEMTYFCENFSS